jgi:phage shock protein A
LIAELKAGLAEQKTAAKEGQRLRKQITDQEDTITELQKKVVELTATLAQSKTENKALQTKLAASRSAEASNAMKGVLVGGKANGNGGQNGTANKAADAVHAAQLKEDLFSDLTGLIVTGVKFQDKEDIFDCLQTGRNGSKLSETLPAWLACFPDC